MADVLEITDGTFEQEVLQSNVPVLVDFWAPWCGPCRQIAPLIEELSKENQGSAKVVKLDVQDNEKIAGEFGVSSIPTLILFKDGREVTRFVGAQPKVRLQDAIDSAV